MTRSIRERLFASSQKLGVRTAPPCVCHEANGTQLTYPKGNTLTLGEYHLTPDDIEITCACASIHDEKPCLPARIESPATVRFQFETLEYEVRI